MQSLGHDRLQATSCLELPRADDVGQTLSLSNFASHDYDRGIRSQDSVAQQSLSANGSTRKSQNGSENSAAGYQWFYQCQGATHGNGHLQQVSDTLHGTLPYALDPMLNNAYFPNFLPTWE